MEDRWFGLGDRGRYAGMTTTVYSPCTRQVEVEVIDNPYVAPQAPPNEHVGRPPVRWLAAVGFLTGSVGFVVIYMSIVLPLIPRHRPTPVWPTIIVPLVLSIACAIRTRNVAIAPLACLLGVSAGSLMFAALQNWAGADTHILVPIAVALSVPSLLIAISSRR